MAQLGRVGFLAIAIVFHLIYTYSIFDIYFVSPVINGMRPHAVPRDAGSKPPAQRLFLMVGDGLRADKAFQFHQDPSPNGYIEHAKGAAASAPVSGSGSGVGTKRKRRRPRPLAPFIRSRVLSHGTFGVSHTRVPTESRPGHVALIAGLYEDVSAVTTGWKLNPVHFDSVFNRSRHTWSWGSSDILPMFKEGAEPGRVDAMTYGSELEDFSQDATKLDTWVFDKVKEFFASAEDDPELYAQLHQDKLVFFLHLLGLDTTGHSYRPYSKEYLHNIKIVDQGVREITKTVENFYGDQETAFIFTADHGMSDWGSHGDGHPDNTRTPLVAWGAGIAGPKTTHLRRAPGHEDWFSYDWHLDHVQRHDVAQADVAALMAYLVGLEFPVNSVGQIPLSYLNATPREKANAALANTKCVLEMYHVKEDRKKATAIKFQPFPPLARKDHFVQSSIDEIESHISNERYDQAITLSSALLKEGLEGLRYLQTYDWLLLRTIVSAGYLGWIAYAITTVARLHILRDPTTPQRTVLSSMFFSSLLVGLYSVLYLQESSWRYYAYTAFPIFFWEEVFANREALFAGRKVFLRNVRSFAGYLSLFLKTLLYIGILEALVQSYFHREIYTVFYVLGAFWPLFQGLAFVRKNRLLVLTWMVGCVLMGIFTLLPVVKVENRQLVSVGGMLMFMVGVLYLVFEKLVSNGSRTISTGSRCIMGLQAGMVLLSVIITRSSIDSLQAKQGLPLGNQVVGWFVLCSSLLLPFVHRLKPNSHYLHRLVVIFLTFSPTFIILTTSYEGVFYFVFCITVLTWVQLEHAIYDHSLSKQQAKEHTQIQKQPHQDYSYRALTPSDARIALFFLFLLQSAFFSTGNIASISSFSLDSVARLIPVFSPFSQAALLILKILIPFAIISVNLGILNHRLDVAPSALFMVVMGISDVLTLNFFYMVKDEGSWLDIGTTISHFCIASGLCTFVAGLEFLSGALIAGVEFEKVKKVDELVGSAIPSTVSVSVSVSPAPAVDDKKPVGGKDSVKATAPASKRKHKSVRRHKSAA